MNLLLAEDEKALNTALTEILKRSGYNVTSVFNGEDALLYLKEYTYDAVILDIMMPKIDGLTALKTLRADKNSVPVILLTAKSEVEDKIIGLDSGADDYLAKPFEVKELLARIRAITRRKGTTDENLAGFSDIKLNKDDCSMSSAGGKIQLTAKEFRMMETFIKSPGKMISSDYFLENVWGWDSEAEMSVVWTYISYLRKKLKNIGSKVVIKAVRGVGYSLENEND